MSNVLLCGSSAVVGGILAPLLLERGFKVIMLASSGMTASPNVLRVSPGEQQLLSLESVPMLTPDDARATEVVANAAHIITATEPGELERLLPTLAAGLSARHKVGQTKPLLLACEPTPGPHKRLQVELQDQLGKAGESALVGAAFHHGVIEGRAIRHADGWIGQRDALLLVDGDDQTSWHGLPVIPVQPFSIVTERQRLVGDLSLRLAGYLGNAAGCESVAQAVGKEKVAKVLSGALQEISGALSLKHLLTDGDAQQWAERCMAGLRTPALDERCAPLCRDPLAFLDRAGPLVTAIRLCLKHKRKPVYLSACLAAVLLYDDPDDSSSQQMRTMIRKKGVAKALRKYCDLGIRVQPHWWAIEFYKAFQGGVLKD